MEEGFIISALGGPATVRQRAKERRVLKSILADMVKTYRPTRRTG